MGDGLSTPRMALLPFVASSKLSGRSGVAVAARVGRNYNNRARWGWGSMGTGISDFSFSFFSFSFWFLMMWNWYR